MSAWQNISTARKLTSTTRKQNVLRDVVRFRIGFEGGAHDNGFVPGVGLLG